MDIQKILQPLTQLQVCLLEHPQEFYASLIEDVTGKSLLVDSPLERMGEVPLRIGQKVKGIIQHRDALYQFETELVDFKRTGVLNLLVLEMPEQLDRVQRRQYFRLEIDLSIQYRIRPNISMKETPRFQRTRTKNISGGGLQIVGLDPVKKGTLLDLSIELPNRNKDPQTISQPVIIKCTGKVVSIRGDGGQKPALGVEFYRIEERDREKLINIIFEEQTRRMRMRSKRRMFN
jgi:c-di-GMP-binding flagellar brake protein YcgR